MRSSHPANEPVNRPPRRRNKKQTLQSKHKSRIDDRLVDGALPEGAYPETKTALHTKFVEDAIAAQGNQPLLNAPYPKISSSESNLSRHYRSTLSQLRSGHCVSLANYQHRVGRIQSPVCPLCNTEDQTVQHLFSCGAQVTNLSLIDLWQNPTSVATFLSTHPSFDLPPLPPHRPRPPPELPP